MGWARKVKVMESLTLAELMFDILNGRQEPSHVGQPGCEDQVPRFVSVGQAC